MQQSTHAAHYNVGGATHVIMLRLGESTTEVIIQGGAMTTGMHVIIMGQGRGRHHMHAACYNAGTGNDNGHMLLH